MNEYIKHFVSAIHIIWDPAIMSSMAKYFFHQFGIKKVTLIVTKHKSLWGEPCVKSISSTLMKHISGLGNEWDNFYYTKQWLS